MTIEATPAPAEGIDLRARSLEIILAGQTASGAFIAGPTFSQYRYAWFRDGAFTAEALDLVGRPEASRRFHDWAAGLIVAAADGIERSIEAVAAGRPPAASDYLHCRYEADGTTGPDDWPTFQLDGPGIWVWSLGHHVRSGGALSEPQAAAVLLAARYLAALWDHPSYDAWEEFPEHVHTSTLAAILAGLRGARELLGTTLEAVTGTAELAIEARLAGGRGALTKWPGNDAVDANLLWVAAPYDLLEPTHPRFAATLSRIESELVSADGGVHRYQADTYYGGGAWLLLTAALGRVYLRRGAPGDRGRAERCLRWIEAQAGPDGSLPEQVAAHAFAPDRIGEWEAAWGPSASPLLWSHATYLALRSELE